VGVWSPLESSSRTAGLTEVVKDWPWTAENK
jgi:hypothetical protein